MLELPLAFVRPVPYVDVRVVPRLGSIIRPVRFIVPNARARVLRLQIQSTVEFGRRHAVERPRIARRSLFLIDEFDLMIV